MCGTHSNSTAHQSVGNLQVFQEVVSYIKGTADAISSDSGLLTLSQYLEVLCITLSPLTEPATLVVPA